MVNYKSVSKIKELLFMKLFKISFISLALVLSSCGMQKLTPSEISIVKINTNINPIEISETNKISVKNLKGESRTFTSSSFNYDAFNDYNFTKNQFSKKRRTLIVSHPYYNPDTIVVRRKLRPVVFSLDVLGAITLYLSPSLIIDLANGNMWKVKKSDKTQNLQFSYNDIYYLARFEYAKEKQTIETINSYLNNYKESPFIKDAEIYKNSLIKRDSLYASIKKNGDYYSAENFLMEYPNSIYQSEVVMLTERYFLNQKKTGEIEWEKIGGNIRGKYDNFYKTGNNYFDSKNWIKAIESYQLARNLYVNEELEGKIFEATQNRNYEKKILQQQEEEKRKLQELEDQQFPLKAIARKINGKTYNFKRGADYIEVSFNKYDTPQESGKGGATITTTVKISGSGNNGDKYYDTEKSYVVEYRIVNNSNIELICTYVYGGRCFSTITLKYNSQNDSIY